MLSAGALAVVLFAPVQSSSEVVVNAQWSTGRMIPGDWVPLVVDLQNAGARNLDVRVRVTDDILRCRVVRPETLPAKGRRRIFVELPGGSHARMFGYGVRPKVSVEGPDGEILARFELASTHLRDASFQVVLVSSARSSEGAFRFPRQSGNRAVELSRADVSLLPVRWTGYTGVDLLVLHDAPLDELSPDQARAILDWVRLGGTVAASPGPRPGWLSHPVLAALAPVEAGRPETRTSLPGLAASQPSLFAAGRPFLHHPVRNGTVDTGTDTRVFSCGLGRVRILPFDVAAAPFAESAGLEALWGEVLGEVRSSAVTAEPDGRLSAPAVLSGLSMQINPYPSYGLLVGLTALFLTVVGPVNWLLLRRLRMTLLLILTVPALSVLFLGLTVGAGYLVKGTGTIVASVRFIVAPPGRGAGVETQLMAVRSPSTRDYRLSFPPGHGALPAERALDGRLLFGTTDVATLEIQDGPRPTFAGFRIGQWESRPIVTKAPVDLGASASSPGRAGSGW